MEGGGTHSGVSSALIVCSCYEAFFEFLGKLSNALSMRVSIEDFVNNLLLKQGTCFWWPLMQSDIWQTCRALSFFVFVNWHNFVLIWKLANFCIRKMEFTVLIAKDQCALHGVAFMMSAMSCPSLSVPDRNSFQRGDYPWVCASNSFQTSGIESAHLAVQEILLSHFSMSPPRVFLGSTFPSALLESAAGR